MESLGTRLRACRTAKNITRKQLGQLSGTDQSVIQKIENGRTQMPRQIEAIAAAVDVNPAWLLFGEPWANRERP
ncbi:hypothetical protein BOW51_02550 [Solemya velesiana gill symbiont]|uniref:HTH cro/C1-type domain-containing protein n=2 Tax=Solemya velesiana gill symbiont TaxID=1918948 RepID=A0A1T2KX88_9GAMM|nr:hypothetical protein BOW51_02550 [Solemya velesiana gill symbiont]